MRGDSNSRTLGAVFDPHLNALNLLRLLLAAGVLFRHTLTMLGTSTGIVPVESFLRSGFVDGFFAISGYLIVASWLRRPDWRTFLRARSLRILPGFWVCLIVTAFVFAPAHALITGFPMTGAFWADAVSYVWKNAFLWIFEEGIDGTPLGAAPAEAGVWNGSLWTLAWEFACYLGVLVLGMAGLLRRRAVLVSLFAGAVIVLIASRPLFPSAFLVHQGARFATMFLAGAMIYTFRRHIPARGWIVAVCAAITLLSGYLPDYRLIAALPLAYLLIVGGALVRVPALRLQNDLSYGTYIYGFPVQQMLIGLGAASTGTVMFFVLSVAAVIPFAAASWFFVEKPANRWGRRPAPAPVRGDGGTRVA